MIRVIDRYVVAEYVKVCLLALFILFFVLILERASFLSNLFLSKHVALVEVIKIFLYISPSFFVLAMPLGSLLGALMCFSRMASDHELAVLKASGVSTVRLAMPVFLCSLVFSGVTLYFALHLEHRGYAKFQQSLSAIMHGNLLETLKAGQFYNTFPGLMVYVQNKQDQQLQGVFIADYRDMEKKKVIEAKKGVFHADNLQSSVVMELFDGKVHLDNMESYSIVHFDSYTFPLTFVSEENGFHQDEIMYMSFHDLLKRIAKLREEGQKHHKEQVALHKKMAAPVGCVILAWLGIFLGASSHRKGMVLGGYGLGFGMIIVNYVFWMLGQSLGLSGNVQPAVAVWMPNLVMSLFATYFMRKENKT